MKTRLVVVTMLILLLVSSLAGASESVIRFNLGPEPQSFDPALTMGSTEGTVLVNLFEGLTRLDENHEPQPGMASRWEISDDGKIYTFYLREAYWSNGDRVTAHDFVYAWLRVLDPETAAPYAYNLYYLVNAVAYNSGELTDVTAVGVRALDDYTLQVELIAPTPYFLSLTAFPVYMPVNPRVVETDPDWALKPDSLVTNGPFLLTEWSHGSRLELRSNPYYWDEVHIDGLVFTMIEASDTELIMFETDQLDITSTVPRAQLSRLRAAGFLKTAPILANYYYIFNVNVPPLDDVRVRQALSMAIDRESITEYVTQAGEIPAFAFIPPGIPHPQGSDFRALGGDLLIEDVDKARQLLAEAGYPNGEGFPKLEIIYNTFDLHRAIAEVIQEAWRTNLGIEVSLVNQEWMAYLNRRFQGDFQIARAGWNGDYLDPLTFMDMYISDEANNHSGWSNQRYDELIQLAKTTTDPLERVAYLHEAEAIIMEEMPVMPIYFYVEPYLQKDHIQGVIRSLYGFVDFKGARVTN
ncbi:MAG: peptide ABC transporter substrate-binding protein [Limnochordia bacterium]